MSASNQKKIRKEKAMAYMSERQRKEAEEQKKLKRYTVTFWIVLALCLCIVLTTVLVNPVKNVVYRNTTAVTIGGHELNAVELNYFYIDAINNYCSQYGNYISLFIQTSYPLNHEKNTDTEGVTWADKFLDMALENIKSTYQLYDLAVKNGFELTEDELKSIDTMMSNLDIYAMYYGYDDADTYLRSMYGNGANAENYRAYYELCTIADCYYQEYSDSLEYEDADLRAYEEDKFWQYSSYTYAYYYFNHTDFLEGGTKGEDGKTTYSDAEKEAAIAVAESLANQIAAGKYEDLDAFDNAINALLTEYFAKDSEATTTEDEKTEDEKTEDDKTEDEDDKKEEVLKYKSTKDEDVLFTKLRALFADWLRGKETTDDEEGEDSDTEKEDEEENLVIRQEGDLTVIVSESGTGDNKTISGYYVLRFGSVNENQFKLKNVRHLLVAYEGGKTDSNGNKTYSDAEKAAAKTEAEKLLEEFKATGMTEEDFEKLTLEHSDDKNSAGEVNYNGLYENIYPGQMVEAFEDWCYDAERKTGDFGLVQTDYGWHIMYYVGESETTYRDYMLENDLHSERMTEWLEGLVKAAVLTEINLKYVNRELVLSNG